MLNRIQTLLQYYIFYIGFFLFSVCWRVKAGGLGQKISAYSDKYCLSEGEIYKQDFYSKDFCDSKNFC